jgi:hypothetical protein
MDEVDEISHAENSMVNVNPANYTKKSSQPFEKNPDCGDFFPGLINTKSDKSKLGSVLRSGSEA